MLLRPLTTNEQASTPGFTHVARITADDLTQTTNATAQTIDLATLAKNDIILRAAGYVRVPFGAYPLGVLDTAFNVTPVSIGDTAGIATLVAAGEANVNGTTVNTLGSTAKIYTAADTLRVTFANAVAGKNLNSMNRGEYYVFVSLSRLSEVANAMAAARISKT